MFSIMARPCFEAFAAQRVGMGCCEEEEDEKDGENVGHVRAPSWLEVIGEVACDDELCFFGAEVVGGEVVGVLEANLGAE